MTKPYLDPDMRVYKGRILYYDMAARVWVWQGDGELMSAPSLRLAKDVISGRVPKQKVEQDER